jgi:O-antigen/teichoic acid export membrane protein
MLKFGAPLIPVAVAYYLITYSDRYFLRYFQGLESVGLYAMSVRVSAVMTLILNGFQMAMGPFVYSHYKEEHAPETFARTFDYVSVAVTLAVTGLALLAADVVAVVGTPAYLPAHVVVPLLATGTAAYGLGAYFSFGIGIAKKTFHRAWVTVLAASMNVVLNLLLVPWIGMVGAATSTALSFLTLAVLQMKISQGYYRVPYKFKRHFVVYGTAAAVIALAYGTGLDRPGFATLPVKAALVGVVLLSAVAAGLVTRREYEYARSLVARALRRR